MWISCNLVVDLLQVGGSPGCLRRGLRCRPRHFAPLWARLEGTQDWLQPPLWGSSCWAAPSPPPACKYGRLTTSAIIIIDEEPEAGEVDLGGLKVFLVRQAEGVVVLAEPRQQVAAKKSWIVKMLEITKTKSQPDESQLICNAFSSCAPASIQISRKNQVGCQKGPKRGKEKVSRNEICDWIHYTSQKKMKRKL